MGRVSLCIAQSKDGFIADKDDGLEWLNAAVAEGEDYGYHSFYASIDSTIMGRSTYDVVDAMDVPFPYPDKSNYVLTSVDKEANDHVSFINQSLISEIINKHSKTWLVGGGGANSTLHDLGLIDEIILTTVPVILGEGKNLFREASTLEHYNLKESQTFNNGVIQEIYTK